jgi:quercetin dioxygenase-like cupin family protein/alkylhydroperoxidase/carboxymuconolactone decarboxylase family protein YurZ
MYTKAALTRFGAFISVIVLTIHLEAQNMTVAETLNSRQRHIVTIAANTAVGNLAQLKHELNGGLDAGLTVNEIKEILVQMYAYAGFPRSLQGINTFIEVLNQRKAKEISDAVGKSASPITDTTNKYERGKKILETLTKQPETNTKKGYAAFCSEIDVFLKEHLFADIFERDVLSYADRELATISALSAMEGVEPMLQGHIKIGKNVGITETQLSEVKPLIEKSKHGIFPKGTMKGSADRFSGTVWVETLVAPKEMENLYAVGNVTFEPRARTHWHTHPAGQVLLVMEGKGFYQEKGKPARPLVKGDVVAIPKDIEHWHGAAPDSAFVHVAISNNKDGNAVTWLTPVTDEEYNRVSK